MSQENWRELSAYATHIPTPLAHASTSVRDDDQPRQRLTVMIAPIQVSRERLHKKSNNPLSRAKDEPKGATFAEKAF